MLWKESILTWSARTSGSGSILCTPAWSHIPRLGPPGWREEVHLVLLSGMCRGVRVFMCSHESPLSPLYIEEGHPHWCTYSHLAGLCGRGHTGRAKRNPLWGKLSPGRTPQSVLSLGNPCPDVGQHPPQAWVNAPLSTSLMRRLNKSVPLAGPPAPQAAWLELLIFPVFMTPWPC